MYTSTIGKIFLDAYNEKYQTEYSAKEFFTEVFIPLFYDHHKYMMTGGNSPLENPKLSWDDMIKGKKQYETQEQRKERIDKIINKIETSKADMSIAIGFGVLDTTNASASQITDLDINSNKEVVYLSWVGAGLGITIAGGYTILFSDKQLLLDIFEGWHFYRMYLEEYPMLKGNQINSWNGLWLEHRYNDQYDEDMPTAGMNPINTLNEGLLNIGICQWLDVLWGIALHYKSLSMLGYIYKIGQTNSTIGFIPFRLDEIKRPYIFWRKIFGEEIPTENISKMKKLYGTKEGLISSMLKGSIGIQTMKPKDLVTYMPGPKSKSVKYKTDEDKVTFNIYLIWIIAMLNNEKMWDLSQDFAKVLLAYEKGAQKASRVRANNVSQLLESSTPRLFIENLIPIVKDAESEIVEKLSQIGKIVNDIPRDNYPYFSTLIKFQYALSNK